jgi:hypothetical protein
MGIPSSTNAPFAVILEPYRATYARGGTLVLIVYRAYVVE